jgi:hypothetical protein
MPSERLVALPVLKADQEVWRDRLFDRNGRGGLRVVPRWRTREVLERRGTLRFRGLLTASLWSGEAFSEATQYRRRYLREVLNTHEE